MAVPTTALYANPPNTTTFPCSISSNSSYDFDSIGRSSSPMIGGLSYLFSSPSGRNAASTCVTDDLRHEKIDDLTSSYCYSPYLNSFAKRDCSPVSVFQGPVSCSSSPLKFGKESGEFSGCGKVRRSNGLFIGRAVSVDYRHLGELDELTFNMEEDNCAAKDLLVNAQSRHSMFYDDLVVKAFHEAEKAHRGQV